MILFKEIEPKGDHKKLSNVNNLTWLTWSDNFRNDYKHFDTQLKKIKEVDFIYLKKYKAYNYSFSVPLSRLDKSFLHDFWNFAYALYHFNPGERIIFFSDLIDNKINARLFHFLFALFRSTLTQITNDKMGALYSPLTSGKTESDFPMHCDLYIPKILFNVYESVPKDKSGASAFLRLDDLFEQVFPQVSALPKKVTLRIKELIYTDIRQDNYEEFFSLLYDADNTWSEKLKQVIDKHKFNIKLNKGQGYMLHDRIWMHGRNKTNGGVSPKRLHRIIFNNFYEQGARS
ncbi:hypothetical protein [Chitinophaga sp. Cy-1792]|uniref:hypothetical protein n=1 Tax=Chitinophaga sp. Cy-1792 TaxID=2608339 RepID=UPI00141EAED5|nr:hypothetical protein [Chitinophaga sp. Cy-1792]NIG56575.1 hypothetical protein [Chitinophaga sp. Cy-1792]